MSISNTNIYKINILFPESSSLTSQAQFPEDKIVKSCLLMLLISTQEAVTLAYLR